VSGFTSAWTKGQIHVLIGPSGCGKSTMLYLAAGLLEASEGEVLIDGIPAAAGRRNTAVILQNHGLFPWKTARDNLALGLQIRGENRKMIAEKVDRMVEALGMRGREQAYPDRLSGGERQRLAIGRALLLDPDLLLLDEPFSSLDAMTREELQDHLWKWKIELSERLTVMLVTHSMEEAVFLGDHIHLMDSAGSFSEIENRPEGPGFRSSSNYFKACSSLRADFARHVRDGGRL